ncbi:glycosyltransferase [Luminiphilus sp.]|nr:glycosyltransferase [Luminiphilus sp.]
MSVDVSIVTVLHNSARYLPAYVGSLIQSASDRSEGLEVIFVENSGRGDDVRTFLASQTAGTMISFKVIDSPNRGFGAGCNLGALHAEGRVVWFVNPDVVFLSGVGALSQVSGWGGCFEEGSDKTELLYPQDWSLRNMFALKDNGESQGYVSGSSLFCERDLFWSVGGFDEIFFMYFEDADLCMRLKTKAAPKYIYDVKTKHVGFGSSSSFLSILNMRNSSLFKYCLKYQCYKPLFDIVISYGLLMRMGKRHAKSSI